LKNQDAILVLVFAGRHPINETGHEQHVPAFEQHSVEGTQSFDDSRLVGAHNSEPPSKEKACLGCDSQEVVPFTEVEQRGHEGQREKQYVRPVNLDHGGFLSVEFQ
jgi:hypothetical protein